MTIDASQQPTVPKITSAWDLTFEQVIAGSKTLDAALADPKMMAKDNFTAEAATLVYLAMIAEAP